MSILLSKEDIKIREKLTGSESIKNREFLALVISNEDPEKMGRIKIRLSVFHRDIADEDLPWASPLSSVTSNGNIGSFYPVAIGSFVYVRFLDETGDNIVYQAVTSSVSLPEVFKSEDYPNIYGLTDQAGNQIIINNKKGKEGEEGENSITVKHQSGSYIIFTKDGGIEIKCKNLIINTQESLNVTSKSINTQATTKTEKTNTTTQESSNFKNIASSFEVNSPNVKVQSQGSVDIEATTITASSTTNNINGTNLNLNGATTALSGTALVSINSASFLCNAVNEVSVITTTGPASGMVLPGVPSVVPVTPPTIQPKTPTKPTEPQNIEPLPVPEIPDVKEKIDF